MAAGRSAAIGLLALSLPLRLDAGDGTEFAAATAHITVGGSAISSLAPAATAALPAQADTGAVATSPMDFSRYEKRTPWVIPPELAEKMAAREAGACFDETKVRSYVLPDLFVLASGERVTSRALWETRRRAEMLEAIRCALYGYAPPKPDNLRFEVVAEDSRAMDGWATRKLVAVRFQFGAEPFLFHIKLFVPNRAPGRHRCSCS